MHQLWTRARHVEFSGEHRVGWQMGERRDRDWGPGKYRNLLTTNAALATPRGLSRRQGRRFTHMTWKENFCSTSGRDRRRRPSSRPCFFLLPSMPEFLRDLLQASRGEIAA